MSSKNLALIFAKIPTGMPVAGEHLIVKDIGFDRSAEPPTGGVTLESLYASFDPYMRGRMRDASIKSYTPAFKLHSVIDSGAIARVLKSATAEYKEGDLVTGSLPVQQYITVDKPTTKADTLHGHHMRKLTTDVPDIRDYLGALGMPGRTAYTSLYEIGQPKRGETIFISSAAGAVGQIVGQIAKHEGLTVVGSVGSEEKAAYIVDELGFDAAFNYKKEKAADALARLAPHGIDIYYENVGGEQLAAALDALNVHGRVVACGMISQYSLPDADKYGVKNLLQIVFKRLTVRGFIVGDPGFATKWKEDHQRVVGAWLKDGTFKAKTHEWVGMEEAANAFVGVLKGENFGKAVLKVKVDEGESGEKV